MAPDPHKERRRSDSEQFSQFFPHIFLHRYVIISEQLRLSTAAHECAEEHMTFRRSAGVLETAEGTSHDFALFDRRNYEAETIERFRKIFRTERQVNGRRRSVGDLTQL